MQSPVLAFVLSFGFVLPVCAQVVRNVEVDRMTDKKTPLLMIPERGGGSQTLLLLQCTGILTARMPAFRPRPGGGPVKFMLRVDRQPPVEMEGARVPSGHMVVEMSPSTRVRDSLEAGTSLALRIVDDVPPAKVDFEYLYGADNAEAFALAAGIHGGNSTGARAAWGVLEGVLSQAAAGANPDVASLMQRIGLPLKEGTRARTAAELLPGITRALNRNREKPIVQEMGRALFAVGWPSVSPWLLNSTDYAADSGPLAAQMEWLKGQCP